MKKEIEKLDNFGRGITFIDNKICFVEDCLPGEIVDVDVYFSNRKYSMGKANSIENKSINRIEPRCPYYKKCGGCNLQIMDYDYENKFKTEKVKDILNKFASIPNSKIKNIVYLDEFNYRNKIVLHGDNKKIGLFKNKTNDIISIDRCLLVDDNINKIIGILNDMINNNSIEEVLIRVSNDSSSKMVSIKGNISNYDVLFNYVDTLIINDKVVKGDSYIITNIGSIKYYLSSKSFFQINKTLTNLLYKEVRDVVSFEKPKYVLDLYCGAGSIGLYISDICEKIVGVEVVEDAIKDANRNKELNNINNIEFICDKVENVIDKLDECDLVVVDPPRAGLDNKTIKYLNDWKLNTIVYVSCDPVTLARDLNLLSEVYEVSYVKPFNMFPRTNHVECVSVLHRRIIL